LPSITLFWLPRDCVSVPPKSYDCYACYGVIVPTFAPAVGVTSRKRGIT
jgi:hypothetical protein